MLDIEVKQRIPRILFIGDGMSNPGAMYLMALKDCGYSVFHVGRGSKDLDNKKIESLTLFIENEVGTSNVLTKNFKLDSLLDLVGHKFDLIFHVQDWTYITGTSSIPYFYYSTEISYSKVPEPTWYVLCATDVIKRIVKRDFPMAKGIIYHPHSIMVGVKIKYPTLKKQIESSFAGEVYRLEIYNKRREIVKYIQKHVDTFEAHYQEPLTRTNRQSRKPESGKGMLNGVEYINLALKSKIILNIPTVGGANFRDIEGPSFGGMLLTIETPDHSLMGFEDGVNCRYYKTKEEAVKIIKDGWDPEIARRGWELIMYGRTWWRHINPNINYNCRFKRTEIINEENSILFFYIRDGYKINKMLNELKKKEYILSYSRKGEILTLKINNYHVTPEQILGQLGFSQWKINGHATYHRMKELSLYFQKFTGITIPQKLNKCLKPFEKKEDK